MRLMGHFLKKNLVFIRKMDQFSMVFWSVVA